MLVILSDLHLGCGDELEDFLLWGDKPEGPAPHLRLRARLELGEIFAKFLATKMAHATGAGLLPTLILLGDTFDLWQTQRPRERPHRALERILAAHIEVFAGMNRWTRAGGRIELIIGAHDQPIIDRRAWSLLREAIPGINPSHGGRPTHYLADENVGLYAEHGHLWDPYYRLRRLDRPDAGCAARDIIRNVVNVLEPLVPLIDKAALLSDVIRIAQSMLKPEHLREAFRLLARVLRSSSAIIETLAPWLEGRAADWRPIAERENRLYRRGLTRAVSPRHGATIGPLPSQPRIFLSGHTHQPTRRTTARGIEYINPGSWKPVLRLDEGRQPEVTQTLPYAQVIPDGTGAWEPSLRHWLHETL